MPQGHFCLLLYGGMGSRETIRTKLMVFRLTDIFVFDDMLCVVVNKYILFFLVTYDMLPRSLVDLMHVYVGACILGSRVTQSLTV